MDLDSFFSVTCDDIDFAKASSLVKNNQATYIKAELLHQLNLSIHNLENKIIQQQEKAQEILDKHFSQSTTVNEHTYLTNKFEWQQKKI